MKRLQSPYDLLVPFFIIVGVITLAIWLGGCAKRPAYLMPYKREQPYKAANYRKI